MPQLEEPTTKIYNYVRGPGGLWGAEGGGGGGEEEKDWQQMLAQVPIFKKKKRIFETTNRKITPCPRKS